MKQIYSRTVVPEVPDNVPKRIFASAIIALPATGLFIGAVCFLAQGQAQEFLPMMLISSILAGIAFLLTFFAIRTKISHESITTRPENTVIPQNLEKPFYSVQCKCCDAMFDYQRSDLAFRPWFIKGYVECPCCHKPIAHNKELNAYIPFRAVTSETDKTIAD